MNNLNNTKKLTQKIVKVPHCVQDTIPIFRISEGGIFELEDPRQKNGIHQFDKVYLFHDINYFTQDETGKEEIDKKYQQILNSLNIPFKIIICNQMADNDKLVESIMERVVSDDLEPLAEAYRDVFRERVKSGRDGLQKAEFFVITCERKDFEMAETHFETLESTFNILFRNIGSGLIPLNATERLRTLHSFYRMGEEKTFSFDWKEYLTLKRDWRNDIINTSLREHKEYLEFEEGKYGCAMFVRKYAASLNDMFVKEITNVPFPMIFTIDSEPLPAEVAYNITMSKYMNNDRAINKEQELKNNNGLLSTNVSYDKRVKQENLEETLESLREYDEKLFLVSITLLIKANSKEQLEQRKEKLRQIATGYNMELAVCSWNQLDAMNTTLPTGARFIHNKRSLKTPELSILTPFDVQEINDSNAYCYGFNQVSKNLIMGNRKLMKNGNGFFFAEPGAGKSFNVKMEMGQVLCFSTDNVICIDPMGEFKDVAEKYKGSYINLSSSDGNNVYENPFHVHGEIYQKQKFYEEKSEFAFAICEQALKPLPLTNRHVAVIDRAVKNMYDEYFKMREAKKTLRGKEHIPSPTLRTLRNHLAKETGNEYAEQLVGELEIFAEGSLNVFSHQQTKRNNGRFTVYGFDGIGKRLRPMAILIMMESITNRIKYNQENEIPTWVYVDEIHEIWDDEYALQAIERMWREVRKRGGICTGISQNLIDAKRNRATKTMVSNSAFKCLMSQGTCDKEVFEELFEVSQKQAEYVNGAKVGTGLIQFGEKIIPFDNTVSKDSPLYWLYNTNFHEIIEEKKGRKINA